MKLNFDTIMGALFVVGVFVGLRALKITIPVINPLPRKLLN